MSLESLRQLRLQRKKPDGVITILVGSRPRWKHDSPEFVHVPANLDPRDRDWRPLIGLWCAVVVQHKDQRELASRVLQAIEPIGARIYGGVDPETTLLCIAEPTEKHQRNLRKSWELLCL